MRLQGLGVGHSLADWHGTECKVNTGRVCDAFSDFAAILQHLSHCSPPRQASTVMQVCYFINSLQCLIDVGWVTERPSGLQKAGRWFDGGHDLTGALHVLQLQLSPPLPSSLAPIKQANPGSPGKMVVKMDRVMIYTYSPAVYTLTPDSKFL